MLKIGQSIASVKCTAPFQSNDITKKNKSLSSKSNEDFESLPPLQMYQMPLKWLQCLMTSASNCTAMSFDLHQTHTSHCHTWISPMESWFIQAVFCWLNMQFKKLTNIISIVNHEVCFNLSSSLSRLIHCGLVIPPPPPPPPLTHTHAHWRAMFTWILKISIASCGWNWYIWNNVDISQGPRS